MKRTRLLKFTSLVVVLLFLALYGSYGVGSRAAIRDPQSAMPKPYWAFVKPQRSAIPTVKNQGWVRNPIDAFVLAKLEEKGLQPSPTADKRTLLRRVTFDLTGLPPTPEEIKAFLADKSPAAYEKVVDRLLASPKYGERWAQHWLDVVRFGETNGFELDADREQAWRYRDYVVNSLNTDKPYDQFILEQIAGDELDSNSFEMRVATGFLRAGPQHVVAGNLEKAELRQEWLTEVMFGVGNGVMGLTVGCARCHDHKFDPIPQADFYRLQAFFAASDNYDYRKPTKEQEEAFQTANRVHTEKLQPIQDQIKAIEKPYQDRLKAQKRAALEPVFANALAKDDKLRTVEEKQLAKDAQRMLAVQWDELVASLSPEDKAKRAALRQQMHQINLYEPEPIPKALAVNDILKPIPTMHLLRGGDWRRPGAEVQPAFLSAVEGKGNVPEIKPVGDSLGRRLALARWLTKTDHPLTARVMVNRLWHHHFGRGIVATPNDFGRNGQQPTHPELLDWLALELMDGGTGRHGDAAKRPTTNHQSPTTLPWSLKHIHRLMVTSATYRQSSTTNNSQSAIRNPQLRNPQSVDPDNKLLWRMNRQRLDAEAIRDAVLAVNGTLNDQAGGAPIRVPLDPEVYDTIFTEAEPDNLWPVHPDARQHARRSLYLLRKRNVRLPMLVAFDSPDMMNSCGARSVSVHALQSLTLMNSQFMFDQSKALASRLFAETAELNAGREDKMIARLYELALGRLPNVAEKQMTRAFLKDQTVILRQRIAKGEKIAELKDLKAVDAASAAAWVDLCLSTYNLNEFVYLR